MVEAPAKGQKRDSWSEAVLQRHLHPLDKIKTDKIKAFLSSNNLFKVIDVFLYFGLAYSPTVILGQTGTHVTKGKTSILWVLAECFPFPCVICCPYLERLFKCSVTIAFVVLYILPTYKVFSRS